MDKNKLKKKSSEQSKQIDATSVDWELSNNAASDWAVSHVGELVRGITDTTRDRIRVEVANFVQNKETIGQLKKRLTSPFGEERAHMIAVTETTRAYAEGNMAAWKESGFIDGKRWNTNRDELVCPLCGPLDDEVVPLNSDFSDGTHLPPRHPRCRCWTTPVPILEEEAIGERPLEEPLPVTPVEPVPIVEPVDVERGRFRDFDASTQTGEAAVESWEMDSSYVAWEKGLTEDERYWMKTYKQEGYESINAALRGIDVEVNEEFLEAYGGLNEAKLTLDTALRQHRLPNDITLWRGGSQPQLNAILDQGRDIGDLKGMVISDDAYMSTSVNKDSVDDFVKYAGDDAFEFEIQAPRGTFGAYIEGMDRSMNEYEYLLARGTKMEILDASIQGGVRKVVARILG